MSHVRHRCCTKVPVPSRRPKSERSMRTTRAFAASLAAVLVCSFTLSGCGGADARRGSHMERGREYFEQGNYEKARVEFRNALQVAPTDTEARFMTARVAEKLGNVNEAAQLYQATID